jgi:predicted DCC family thiol-disulfide oxidoreductase YuxK
MSIAEAPADAKPAEVADPRKGKAVVLYDGLCPLCQRGARILKQLDWFKRLHYQDCRDTAAWPPSAEPLTLKRLLEEMHVVTPDRKHAPAGYKAFRWMAWRLPLTLPIAPLLYLPGVPWIGNKIYLWVAKNRYDLVPCDDGGCRLPLRKRTEDREQRTEDREQKSEGKTS